MDQKRKEEKELRRAIAREAQRALLMLGTNWRNLPESADVLPRYYMFGRGHARLHVTCWHAARALPVEPKAERRAAAGICGNSIASARAGDVLARAHHTIDGGRDSGRLLRLPGQEQLFDPRSRRYSKGDPLAAATYAVTNTKIIDITSAALARDPEAVAV